MERPPGYLENSHAEILAAHPLAAELQVAQERIAQLEQDEVSLRSTLDRFRRQLSYFELHAAEHQQSISEAYWRACGEVIAENQRWGKALQKIAQALEGPQLPGSGFFSELRFLLGHYGFLPVFDIPEPAIPAEHLHGEILPALFVQLESGGFPYQVTEHIDQTLGQPLSVRFPDGSARVTVEIKIPGEVR